MCHTRSYGTVALRLRSEFGAIVTLLAPVAQRQYILNTVLEMCSKHAFLTPRSGANGTLVEFAGPASPGQISTCLKTVPLVCFLYSRMI